MQGRDIEQTDIEKDAFLARASQKRQEEKKIEEKEETENKQKRHNNRGQKQENITII